MSNVLAIVPARSGSQGIPNKNWKPLVGVSPVTRAIECAQAALISHERYLSNESIVVSADDCQDLPTFWRWLQRPPELAQDDTPMIAVVQHVLEQIPGPPDQQIVLLQPTQPLRTYEHVTRALALLTPDVDSVVSVVELPQTHAAVNHAFIATDGTLVQSWDTFTPTRRQDCGHSYIRDGSCYAFWRKTVEQQGSLYGARVVPLIVPREYTCSLDTESDWREAERRLQERT